MPVRPSGRLMQKDADGYLVSRASRSLLPARVQPVVSAAVIVYRRLLGANLHSVWVRGSAVTGTFVPGVSDIDTWALLKRGTTTGPRILLPFGEEEDRLNRRYAHLGSVELCATAVPRLRMPDARFARLLLATTAIPVWGVDLRPSLGRFRPGKDTVHHATHVRKSVAEMLHEPPPDTHEAQRWICKALVRAGLERYAHAHRQYTRDLFPCYAMFAAFRPDLAEVMHRCLELAIDPNLDAKEFATFLTELQSTVVPAVHMD